RLQLAGMKPEPMRGVITDVHHRLDQFVMGRASSVPCSGEYARIGGGHGWIFAEVTHQTAREKMVASGVRAAVDLFGKTETPDGLRYLYSVWRRSEYVVGFPVHDILCALNRAEGFQPIDPKGWGGAENVGGSPRGRGSALAPADVERVVNLVIPEGSPPSLVPKGTY